ncbi:hypothetical protein [Streptosporangium sp. NPDC049644]|uniref:hypothetical protein n=1 Tax=Streptosporangium sp. NPDC049644 TaxID=3155507 RepID=UPI0034323ECD
MAEQHRVAALCAFVDQLNELRGLAGSPPLSRLHTLSMRIPENNEGRGLAPSTTHDILTGKRKRAPAWAWVASFVAACTTAAKQTGLDVQAMGDTQTWYQSWRAAHDARSDPPAVPTEPATPALTTPSAGPAPAVFAASPSPAQRPEAEQAPSTPAPPARPTSGRAPHRSSTTIVFAPLPAARQRLLRIYGRTGTRLLNRSEAGNGDDCMRLAVIALLKGWPQEARQWLRQAGDAGHPAAPGLFDDPDRLQVAAELAYHYGHRYQCSDPNKLSVAMFLYRLASDHGHAEAAYRLARIHRAKDEDWAAASLFSRAADNGHPEAAAEFDGASEQLTQPPWNAEGALPIGLIEEQEPATEPPSPAGDPPAEFT